MDCAPLGHQQGQRASLRAAVLFALVNFKGTCPTLATGGMTTTGAAIQLWTGVKSTTQKAPILIHWHCTGGTGAGAPADLGSSLLSDIMADRGVALVRSQFGEDPLPGTPYVFFSKRTDRPRARFVV